MEALDSGRKPHASRALPPAGRWMARFRGVAILAAITAGTWSLVQFVERVPARVAVLEISGSAGGTLLLVLGEALDFSEQPSLTILSHEHVAFDPERSLLRFDDGDERVIPGGARGALVTRPRLVQPVQDPPLPPGWVAALRRAPDASRFALLQTWISEPATSPGSPPGAALPSGLREFGAARP